MNVLLKTLLQDLRSGVLASSYEQREILNDLAMTIYNIPELDIPHLEDLKDILTIANICYNDTDRELLPIEDGFYDLLLEKYKKYDANFQVGAEVIKFKASTPANLMYVKKNMVPAITFTEPIDYNETHFANQIVIDQTKYIDHRDFAKMKIADPDFYDSISKRHHDTVHNHPELVGTLDKCKFVLEKDAAERGVIDDANVQIVERDFFQNHLMRGIIQPNQVFDMILELKYDGISVEADCTDEVVSARSRGDTGVGQAADLTPFLKGYKFYHRSPDAPMIGVKFEAIMTQTDLPYFNAAKGYEYKNCRSAIVGLLSSGDAWKYREFITLVPLAVEEKVYREVCHSDRLEEIQFLNREFVSKGCPLRHALVSGTYIENLAWINIFTKNAEAMRLNVPFMYDGIVASYRDESIRQALGRENYVNKFSIAVKFNPMKKETIFRGYSYTVGAEGSITPMIHYDPVEFYGTIHSKSSGHSLARFNELNLRIGNVIDVEYVNDVMPYVTKPENEFNENYDKLHSPEEFPYICPICGSQIAISKSSKSAKCTNPDCGGRRLARMVNTCAKLRLDGFGEATIAQLDIYHMKDLLKLVVEGKGAQEFMAKGFGPVESQNMVSQLTHLMTRQIPISEVLGAIGFSNISTKTWEAILPKIDYDKLHHLFNLVDPNQFYYKNAVDTMASVRGIGPTTANTIGQEFKFFQDDVDYMVEHGNVVNYVPKTGRKIMFSGFRDHQLEEYLESLGFIARGDDPNITSDVLVLIVDDKSKRTTKQRKAKQYGIPIVTLDEFKRDFHQYL